MSHDLHSEVPLNARTPRLRPLCDLPIGTRAAVYDAQGRLPREFVAVLPRGRLFDPIKCRPLTGSLSEDTLVLPVAADAPGIRFDLAQCFHVEGQLVAQWLVRGPDGRQGRLRAWRPQQGATRTITEMYAWTPSGWQLAISQLDVDKEGVFSHRSDREDDAEHRMFYTLLLGMSDFRRFMGWDAMAAPLVEFGRSWEGRRGAWLHLVLPRAQREVLGAIRQRWLEVCDVPTLQEIADELELPLARVSDAIERLRRRGVLSDGLHERIRRGGCITGEHAVWVALRTVGRHRDHLGPIADALAADLCNALREEAGVN